MQHALLRTAIDWTRVGFQRPIPETLLARLARDAVEEDHPHLDSGAKKMRKAISVLRVPAAGAGRAFRLIGYTRVRKSPARG